MRTSRSKTGRAGALEMATEARRLISWWRGIAEDYANAIQARITTDPRSRPAHVQAEIDEFTRQRARAWMMTEHYEQQAERYEKYCGLRSRGVPDRRPDRRVAAGLLGDPAKRVPA